MLKSQEAVKLGQQWSWARAEGRKCEEVAQSLAEEGRVKSFSTDMICESGEASYASDQNSEKIMMAA